MAKVSKERRENALARLRELLKPGDTVHTVLRDVSRSGMSRNIDCYVIADGEPRWISRYVADACGMTFNEKRECIRIGGCGMDMGFAIVYDLSHTLYPDGFGCIGEDRDAHRYCPSNDHSNGDRDYTPHHGAVYTAETCPGKPCSSDCDHKERDGRDHWHKSGGYALRHKWM